MSFRTPPKIRILSYGARTGGRFLIVGLGVDDAFVLVSEYWRAEEMYGDTIGYEARISNGYRKTTVILTGVFVGFSKEIWRPR